MSSENLEKRLSEDNLKIASLSKRAYAFFIDDFIISILFVVMFWDRFKTLESTDSMILFMNSLFIYIMVVKTLYQAVFISMYGATLGKMALKIHVVDVEYLGQPSFSEALLRAVMRIVSEALFYIGFLSANFNDMHQTWHDKFGKTLVVDD